MIFSAIFGGNVLKKHLTKQWESILVVFHRTFNTKGWYLGEKKNPLSATIALIQANPKDWDQMENIYFSLKIDWLGDYGAYKPQ